MHTPTAHDELADAMLDAPELCAQCGKPLDDDNQYLCDGCTEAVYCADSDICEPWDIRYSSYYQPARQGISVLGVLLLATLLATGAGTALWQHVQAQDTTLTAPHAINGRIYTWPAIGTAAYSRSCGIVRFWEDGSSIAYCAEDAGVYRFDPELGEWSPMTSTR